MMNMNYTKISLASKSSISDGLNGIMFSYTIKNLKQLLSEEKTALHSPVYYLQRLPIQLEVVIQPKNEKKPFGVFLYIDAEKTIEESWSCTANVEMKLVSFNADGKDHHKTYTKLFGRNNKGVEDIRYWGFPSFMPLFDVVKAENGFIKNDSVTVDVKVKLKNVKIGM